MDTKFYLIAITDNQLIVTRDYDTLDEAYDNKEFLERYGGYNVRLKVRE